MWGTELNKNLGKICLFTVLSYFGISSAYSAPLTTSIADTATRFEVIAVDTPSIPKGGSGVQTANVKNFGATATGTVAEVRGSPTSGVSITSVVWGDGTPCALSNQIYSCAIGTVGSSTAFDIKITYAVSQSAVTSTSVQQTTIAVRSNQPDLGSGAGESIH